MALRRTSAWRFATACRRVALVAALLGLPTAAGATAIAHASLTFGDVTITPAAGEVLFVGPWTLQAVATANNSLGEFDDDAMERLGPDTAAALAEVTFASGEATATDPAPTPPFLDIGAGAAADAEIPGAMTASAIALGRGTIRRDDPFVPTGFQIVGGTGPVAVDFGVQLAFALELETDFFGQLAEAEVIFGEELIGDDIGFQLLNEFSVFAAIGPNQHFPFAGGPLTGTPLLTSTLELTYGVLYTLLLEADAEVRVVNAAPEPATLWLLALAVPLLFRRRRS